MGQMCEKRQESRNPVSKRSQNELKQKKNRGKWYTRQSCKRAGRGPRMLPSNHARFIRVPPSAGQHQECWAGWRVSAPMQRWAWLTSDTSTISSNTAQVGMGKLKQSLWSLQGLLHKGLSQNQTQWKWVWKPWLLRSFLLAAMILGALGKTYKLCFRKYLWGLCWLSTYELFLAGGILELFTGICLSVPMSCNFYSGACSQCLISHSPHASPGWRKSVLPLLPRLQPLSCHLWVGPFLFNINMLLCWMPRLLLIIEASDACEKCEAGLQDKHSNPVTSSAQGALWVQLCSVTFIICCLNSVEQK